tara:strand:+ start:25383 stop:26531 length:1149 start_codon:yes stop_codon:yes gene_type:complete
MDLTKIMLVFGTRPEAIKMAPIYLELMQHKDKFETLLCVTGQHREMLDQVLDIFDITPDIDLSVMEKDQDLFDVTSKILIRMKDCINKYKPKIILVHGDTTTTAAASVAAFYSNVKIGHVEAGLRTNDIKSPYPEEFNRKLTSIVTDMHFTPTEESMKNLERENIKKEKIYITGNTVIDSLFMIREKFEQNLSYRKKFKEYFLNSLNFNVEENSFVLITGHRRENFGSGFIEICHAIKDLASKYEKYKFVYPVHLNPNVNNIVHEILDSSENVMLIQPLEYEKFIYLLKNCYLVLTDSGGIQEEAPSFGKPVVVMRDVTERPEAVKAGTVKLVGANRSKIVETVSNLIEDDELYACMSKAHNPYGDGNSSKKIVKNIISILE